MRARLAAELLLLAVVARSGGPGISSRRAQLSTAARSGSSCNSAVSTRDSLASFRAGFADPPTTYGPSCFWWWFGAPYTERDIRSAIDSLRAAGLGGFRVYPVYAFPGADLPPGVRNAPYLSPEFVRLLGAAVEYGSSAGLNAEVFLASGWPFGGPYIPPELGAGQLKYFSREVRGTAAYHGRVPGEWEPAERIVAVHAAEVGAGGEIDLARVIELTSMVAPDGSLSWNVPPGRWLLMTFVGGFTGMKVKRAAPGGEGLVLDHFSRQALTLHLERNGNVQRSALTRAIAVGMDSLEVFNSNWTPSLPAEFQRRRGYPLEPKLPALFNPAGDAGRRVRYDFRRTISELALENFFEPLATWAHNSGLKLRAQAHGTPADILEAYATADMPEAETYGPEDRHAIQIRDRKLASSAAHLAGRTQISCESFTWLRFPMFKVTLENMKAAADAIYLDGINQVNYHGVPFSPEWAKPPGFYFYASTFVSPSNTWWPYLRGLSDYLRRVNYVLQQGQPVARIAVYLPIEDVWSEAYAAWYDLAGGIEARLRENGSEALLSALRDAGFDFDFINARRTAAAKVSGAQLISGPMHYDAVVLPSIETIEPEALERLRVFARAGGVLIAAGRLPDRSPGYLNADVEGRRVRSAAEDLFRPAEKTIAVRNAFVPPDPARNLAPPVYPSVRAVMNFVEPDFVLEQRDPEIGFVHRVAVDRDIFFVANVSPVAKTVRARFRTDRQRVVRLDPMDGRSEPAAFERNGAYAAVELTLAPYGSSILVFDSAAPARSGPPVEEVKTTELAITGPWRFSRAGAPPVELQRLRDWTTLPGCSAFSGTATYAADFRVPRGSRRPNQHVSIDLGEVQDVAEVLVNGVRAGVAWKHPYVLDVTRLIRAGRNRLEVRVTNRLINAMLADQQEMPAPYFRIRDYVAGHEPSGLRGPVKLRISNADRQHTVSEYSRTSTRAVRRRPKRRTEWLVRTGGRRPGYGWERCKPGGKRWELGGNALQNFQAVESGLGKRVSRAKLRKDNDLTYRPVQPHPRL